MSTTTTNNTFRRFFGVLAWLLLVPSALTALGAAWMLASGLNLLGDSRTAEGRVVGHQDVTVGTSQQRAFAQHSIVEFVTSDGRAVRFTDSVARRNQAVHKVGEAVTVRYPAKDPAQAEISGSTGLKVVIGAVLLLFSAIGVGAGVLLLRFRPRAAPSAVR